MSLLKWKKLAKTKTESGDKINFVHDAILKNQLGENTRQESFQKLFKPKTTKLDDVALSNLKLPKLQAKRGNKMAVSDHGIQAGNYEDIPDYALDDLFDDGIQPKQNKQLVPKPPTYKESLADILEQQDLPPEYDEDKGPINEPGMTPTKIRSFLNKVVIAKLGRNQLKGCKTQVTKAYDRGEIEEA